MNFEQNIYNNKIWEKCKCKCKWVSLFSSLKKIRKKYQELYSSIVENLGDKYEDYKWPIWNGWCKNMINAKCKILAPPGGWRRLRFPRHSQRKCSIVLQSRLEIRDSSSFQDLFYCSPVKVGQHSIKTMLLIRIDLYYIIWSPPSSRQRRRCWWRCWWRLWWSSPSVWTWSRFQWGSSKCASSEPGGHCHLRFRAPSFWTDC